MLDPRSDDDAAAWWCDLTKWDAAQPGGTAQPRERLNYGPGPDQHVDVWGDDGPIVFSVHGGYFLPGYDKTLQDPMARELLRRRYRVCNVEYRRGRAGRAATVSDLWDAVTAVAQRFSGSTLAVVGHSAGGYLAEVAAAHPVVRSVVCLAPVSDLAEASRRGWDDDGIAQWMGYLAPAAWEGTSLAAMVMPSRAVDRVILHGDADTEVNVRQSRRHVAALRERGVPVEYRELPGEGHYGYLDPREPVFAVLTDVLARVTQPDTTRGHRPITPTAAPSRGSARKSAGSPPRTDPGA